MKIISYGWENIHISEDIDKIKNTVKQLRQIIEEFKLDIKSMDKIIVNLNSTYKNISQRVMFDFTNVFDSIYYHTTISFSYSSDNIFSDIMLVLSYLSSCYYFILSGRYKNRTCLTSL